MEFEPGDLPDAGTRGKSRPDAGERKMCIRDRYVSTLAGEEQAAGFPIIMGRAAHAARLARQAQPVVHLVGVRAVQQDVYKRQTVKTAVPFFTATGPAASALPVIALYR